MTTIKTDRKSKTFQLVINRIFVALTFEATWLINIGLPLI